MFNNFPLAGLTIEALTAQVIGFLNNAFVVGAILAALALPFAVRVASAIQMIVVGGVPQALQSHFGPDDDEYGSGDTWHERWYGHLMHDD